MTFWISFAVGFAAYMVTYVLLLFGLEVHWGWAIVVSTAVCWAAQAILWVTVLDKRDV